jgi:hypothetical protein
MSGAYFSGFDGILMLDQYIMGMHDEAARPRHKHAPSATAQPR